MHDVAGILLAFVLVVVAAGLLVWCLRQARIRRKLRGLADPAKDYAARADWRRSSGTVNYSSFVYFDIDRDGKYGLADRPMAGIMVRLFDGRGGFVAASRTNPAGFANFPMSGSKRRAVIHSPGAWRFSVSVPPGWRSGSGNEDQTRHLLRLPGSPTGLGSQEMPHPVGLAPVRHVRGRMATNVSATVLVTKNGQVLDTRLLEAPVFDFEVADDADTFEITGSGLDRRLALSAYPADLGLLSPGCLAGDAVLQTIGFDDLTASGLRKIPYGYAGLEWRNLNAMLCDHTKGSEGYVNGNVSGSHIAYTSSGHPAEFGSERPFGFHSVMLTAAWLKSEGETALIESWLGEELVASDQVRLSALTPLHYAPMLHRVTRVRLSTAHYWQVVLDDLVLMR